MSWTQPVCDKCWESMNPGRSPIRLQEPDVEMCCYCGFATKGGIYVRVNPLTVPYPAREES